MTELWHTIKLFGKYLVMVVEVGASLRAVVTSKVLNDSTVVITVERHGPIHDLELGYCFERGNERPRIPGEGQRQPFAPDHNCELQHSTTLRSINLMGEDETRNLKTFLLM